jgi:DNA-directed RNA polymerase beta' subunit
MGEGKKCQDDLTHQLQLIIKINEEIRQNMSDGAPELIIDNLTDRLQISIAHITDNDIPHMPQSLQVCLFASLCRGLITGFRAPNGRSSPSSLV